MNLKYSQNPKTVQLTNLQRIRIIIRDLGLLLEAMQMLLANFPARISKMFKAATGITEPSRLPLTPQASKQSLKTTQTLSSLCSARC